MEKKKRKIKLLIIILCLLCVGGLSVMAVSLTKAARQSVVSADASVGSSVLAASESESKETAGTNATSSLVTTLTEKAMSTTKALPVTTTVIHTEGPTDTTASPDGLEAPVILSVKKKDGADVVRWSTVKNAVGYTLYRQEAGEKFKKLIELDKQDASQYADKTVSAKKKYYYAVQAFAASGKKSALSNERGVSLVDPKKPMVALTFDDGPYSPATNRILDVLEKYDSRATFFVVGSRVGKYASCLCREKALGCEIGNHTYNHKTLTKASASQIREELSDTSAAVKKITGSAPIIMRPPGGAINKTVRQNCPYPMILWSVDTLDWKTRNASSTVAAVKKNVHDGSIVLMHDLYVPSAAAAEQVVPWLISKGYQLVTVSEMMEAKGITMKDGSAYSSAR